MRVLFFESNWVNIQGLPDGFTDLGHKVVVSGKLIEPENKIPLLIQEFCPDFIVTIGWGPIQEIHNQKLIHKYAKQFNVPHVYWATEDPHFCKTFTLPLIHRMKPEFVFTLTPELVSLYQSKGFKAAHMDFAFHPSIHHPTHIDPAYACNIAIVANAYPEVLSNSTDHYRNTSLAELLRPLLDQNIRVDIWGKNWEDMHALGYDIPKNWLHGFLPFPETNKLYNSAKVVIGLQNYQTQVTQRTREVLASGGFLLTSDTPEIRRLFNVGEHLVVSSSPKQTLKLIHHYLYEHPDARQTIANNAPRAVEKDTFTRRAKYMIDVLTEEGVLPSNREI